MPAEEVRPLPQNLVDWLIVGFLALGVLNGFRRGFLASALGVVTAAAALALATLAARPLVTAADRFWNVVDRAAAAMAARAPLPPELAGQHLSEGGLAALATWIHVLPWPPLMREQLDRSIHDAAVRASTGQEATVGEFVYHLAATAALELVAFTVVFLVAVGTLRTVAEALARGLTSPLGLGGLNQLAGGALGLVVNGLTAAVMLSALTGVSVLVPSAWSESIRSSTWAATLMGLLDHVTRIALQRYASG